MYLFRKNLKPCFDELKCFLMPHPGREIEKPDFNGAIRSISVDFIQHLKVR
jgi:atlastin